MINCVCVMKLVQLFIAFVLRLQWKVKRFINSRGNCISGSSFDDVITFERGEVRVMSGRVGQGEGKGWARGG